MSVTRAPALLGGLALVLALGCFAPTPAQAATQTRSPSSCANVGGIGTEPWSNAADATASDDARATATVDGETTNYLRCLGYGFAIPAGSTVNGIMVNVERHSSRTQNGGSEDAAMRLVKGGVIGATDRSSGTSYTTSDTYESHGGAGDLWGETWTPSDINAADFGAAFAATKPAPQGQPHQIRVDHIEITVDYTPPAFPVVMSMTRAGADPVPSGSIVLWTVTFSTAVTGVDASDFQLVPGGAVAGAGIISVTGGGTTWTVSASTGTGDGTLALSLIDDDSIVGGGLSLGGSGAGNGDFAGEAYTLGGCTLTPGLLGTYFDNRQLIDPPAGTRVDGPIDFDWGGGAPGVAGIGADQFSVRWEGTLSVETARTYRFRTISDDGVRLWVNDVLVIDNWTDHASTTDTSGDVALAQGTYPIRLEFYENGGNAEIVLQWGWCTGLGCLLNIYNYTEIPAGSAPAGAEGLYHCAAPPAPPAPVALYAMDEVSWTGAAGEVEDASRNGRHGTASGGATTAGTTPAIAGSPGTCRYGAFDGVDDHVQVANLSSVLNGTASLAFWIRTTQSGNDTGWEAPGVTGVEQSGGADDIFWGWLDGSGRIGVSVGNDYSTKSTVAINSGSWRHVVLTRDHTAGEYRIYIDGVLNASGAIATGLIGTPFASIGRIEDTGGTPEYFAGDLDEVRVYDFVLDDAQVAAVMNETRPCASAIDHIRIEHGSGSGLTCNPSTVTLRACADAACTVPYTGGVTGSLTATGAPTVNFIGGAAFSIPSGSSSVTRELRVTTPGSTVLGTSGVSPAPAGSSPACNFGSPACTFTAFDAGFLLDVPDHTAGTVQNVTLAAVRTDDSTQRCVPAFQNVTRTVEFWSTYLNPNSGTLALNVNGTDVAGAAPGTGLDLAFDASGETTLAVRYPDVGQVRLAARYRGGGDEAGLVMNGQDDFVARPDRFELSFDPANPGAVDAAGGVFVRAGQDFRVTVVARNANGAVTPNYGRESPAESVQLAKALVAPAGGNDPALTGGFGPFGQDCAGNPAAPGTACGTFNWTEVGIIALTPGVADGDYLATGNVTGPARNAGRFIPDHFALSGGALVNRVDAACVPASPYTYMGETLALGFTLTAQSASPGNTTTENYEGAFARLDPASIGQLNFGAIDAAGPTPLTGRLALAGATGAWVAGTATVQARLALARAGAPDGPFRSLGFGIAPLDDDGVGLLAGALDLDADNDGTDERGRIATGDVRYGRLFLQNAFGSELLPLAMPLQAQYYAGAAGGFVRNADDHCTAVAPGALNLASVVESVAGDQPIEVRTGIETQASFATPAFAAGDAGLFFSAPGTGGDGYVDVDADAGTPAWLRFDWDANAGTPEAGPRARATFGVYRGSERHIYRRERY